ncbi:MAG: formylglycine-generating enzyme family protein [Bacteroidetes bacterium]|nr:formylglycine-generating enzyme family protein [Bacteroidota bacterium]MBU1579511.1 formylglycine-generating enzyme family protein [Bacteroidota bacterium]MBU2466457.1 formylglycine-generating enzyme family protein [Bacteroidota bacterium]MBU2558842.1 formylglycine-generating enzyme family protein [Bacteroidota bacterium]
MNDNTLCITLPDETFFEMVNIPLGSFIMGSNGNYKFGDDYQRIITINYNFLIGKYSVTQALWLSVMGGENPSYFKGMNRPVEQVSWYDAVVFCNCLSELCGLHPVYFSDSKYQNPFGKKDDKYVFPNTGKVFVKQQNKGFRLPNEAEWEYAAKGIAGKEESLETTTGQYLKYAGANKLNDVGWYSANSHNETKPVGLKFPNMMGLHDMSGNVWEWCNDHWHNSYKDAPSDGSAWYDKMGRYRVQRGGSCSSIPRSCRVTDRDMPNPGDRSFNIGFRLVLVSAQV